MTTQFNYWLTGKGLAELHVKHTAPLELWGTLLIKFSTDIAPR